METRPTLRPFLASLAVAAAVALAPGPAALADPGAPSRSGSGEPARSGPAPLEGPTCSVDAEPAGGASFQALQHRLRAELSAGETPAVVLNGRGYNYRPEQDLDAAMARVRAEARAAHRSR